jgi:hypothetical protein
MPEINIKYAKSIDYKMVSISGVWGGADPQGNVTCEFYLEKVDHPDSVKITVDDESKVVKEEPQKKGKEELVREIQVGMSLNPQLARSIGQWLVKKADDFEKMKDTINHEFKKQSN